MKKSQNTINQFHVQGHVSQHNVDVKLIKVLFHGGHVNDNNTELNHLTGLGHHLSQGVVE